MKITKISLLEFDENSFNLLAVTYKHSPSEHGFYSQTLSLFGLYVKGKNIAIDLLFFKKINGVKKVVTFAHKVN